ncbi:MAG: 4-hydroxyphenylacetate 3-hydroxylase N-terminal domain-containing protein [Thermodesulfobacteriota bacterium]
MALKTRMEYIASLKKLRPNIYKFGQKIEDVTTNSFTRRVVESHARAYDAAHDPDSAALFTTTSTFTGEKIHRHNSLMTSMEDVMANSKMKRRMYQLTGTCTGGLCAGWNAMNTMWAVTFEVDKAQGTDYHERLKNWILQAQSSGWTIAGALTDAKGNRSLKASQQPDLDTNLRIIAEKKDGLVIRGAKLMICGVAASNEIFVLPGTTYGEAEKDFAVACVVPRDIEGLTIIETRRPSDTREQEEGFDIPVETGITQAYLIFEDVFVPKERVFLGREFAFTGKIIQIFTSIYRACIGACVAGQGDIMIGAAMLMARANGLSARTFSTKLVDMAINNETTFAMGIGSIALGSKHPSGIWVPDSLTAHANKVHVATLPYETKRLCQEIGGGIVETGCFPAYRDFIDPQYGKMVQKYLQAGPCSAEARARAARLTEWLTLGAGVPGCMHGGGSPDGARLVVRALTPMEKYAEMAKKLAGIREEIPEPGK